ncbi:MAG: hypothetical protein EXR84_14075 [Gammaproteobacteria bacterium]|nr:hypothetical protein [Gammaproteobacteria bacterium]
MMAKSQKQRDIDSAEKKKVMGAEEFRLTTHPGTRSDIDVLLERFEFTTKDEMFSTIIRNLVAMPKDQAAPAFGYLRHDYELSEKWRKKADREANKLRALAGQLSQDEQEDEADDAANE